MAFQEVYPTVYVNPDVDGESIQRIEMGRLEHGQVAVLQANYVPNWIPKKDAERLIAEVRHAQGD
jgi:hypothetical protein